MQFVVPVIWFAIAIGVYVYNQQGNGHIVMFGLEYVVGNDVEARSLATVALAVFLGLFTGVRPAMAMLSGGAKPESEDED